MSWPPGRTALYRLYDADSVLLYIGITHDLEERWKSHAATKDWWPDVASKVIEWRDERDIAEAAETAAIHAEHPLHNVAKSPWAPKRRELSDREMKVSDAQAALPRVIARVQSERTAVYLVDRTRERRRIAAFVPCELAPAIEAAGGPDAAIRILQAAAQ